MSVAVMLCITTPVGSRCIVSWAYASARPDAQEIECHRQYPPTLLLSSQPYGVVPAVGLKRTHALPSAELIDPGRWAAELVSRYPERANQALVRVGQELVVAPAVTQLVPE